VLATSNAHVPDFDVENFTYIRYPVNKSVPFANTLKVSETMVAIVRTVSLLRKKN